LKVDAAPVSARFPECAHARPGRQVPGLPLDSLPMFLIELVAADRVVCSGVRPAVRPQRPLR
jgi:hypothetical protein